MPSLKFPYIPETLISPITQKAIGTIYRPKIPVRLSYNHKVVPFPVESLIDSGSDTNLFPAQWGQVAGINIKKGSFKQIVGIGNAAMHAYTHRVKLYIGTYSFNTDVDFGLTQQVPLLGRTGFFNQFSEVKFLEPEKKIILTW